MYCICNVTKQPAHYLHVASAVFDPTVGAHLFGLVGGRLLLHVRGFGRRALGGDVVETL